jgi:hypothetical protein
MNKYALNIFATGFCLALAIACVEEKRSLEAIIMICLGIMNLLIWIFGNSDSNNDNS